MASTSTTSYEAEINPYMNPSLYNAAAEGDIAGLQNWIDRLHQLLTPNKNTVLHTHITAQCGTREESTKFVEQILNTCQLLLLQANAKDEIPLHIAARYGRSRTVEVLIERAKALHGQDLERGVEEARQMLRMTNKEKDTALHEAVRFNHLDVVKLLTKEDPDFSYLANDAGETPLYLAAERGFSELVSHILHNYTSPAHDGPNALTALHAAVIRGNEEISRKILEVKGAGLTKEVDQQGWTPLHYAARLGYLPIVRLLLQYDISAAYFADRDDKKTALHIAAAGGDRRIMKEIISRCPYCWELVDKRGWNVLHFAVQSKEICAISVVLKYSSLTNLLNEKDNAGNTPLHLGASHNYINGLIQHPRVDKMAFNQRNLSALDICFASYGFIVPRLERAGARLGQRSINNKDDVAEKEAMDGEDGEKNTITNRIMKAKETHLVVTTLIATVTFAAGFTLPGGYISDKGQDQGSAILTRKAAFRAFVISDTIAMMLSFSSVFIHLYMPLFGAKKREQRFYRLAYQLTAYAMEAMLVAFMTGLYAVLEDDSSGLAIATCVIVCCFFFLYVNLPSKANCRLLRKAMKEYWKSRRTKGQASTYMAN